MKITPFPLLLDNHPVQRIPPTFNPPVNEEYKPVNVSKTAHLLILPWPDKRLSPNQRMHWAKRAKAVKMARQIGFNLAQQAGWNGDVVRGLIHPKPIDSNRIDFLTRRYDLILDFYPPDHRKRDDDNLIAAFKPYRDGIAQALNMDDFRFRTVATLHKTVIKHGQVKVQLG